MAGEQAPGTKEVTPEEAKSIAIFKLQKEVDDAVTEAEKIEKWTKERTPGREIDAERFSSDMAQRLRMIRLKINGLQ